MNYKDIYSEDELYKLQQVETNLLKFLSDFCNENDIEYFIVGGTALGAVRHGGFIPWDDDIDIGMTRVNYEKFIKLGIEKINSPLFLQCFETDSKTPFPYAKLRLNDTRFIEYSNRNIKMHQGIYIDIFPFDYVPDDYNTHIKWFSRVQKLIKLYVLRTTPDYWEQPISFKAKFKVICFKIRYYILHLIPVRFIYTKLNKLITKYNNTPSNTLECAYSPKALTCYGTIDTFLPVKDIKFGDIIVKAPKDINKYLTNEYGDFMKLPPEDKRYGHKPYKIELPAYK